jgi:glycosyltransferase involved in cell wall biosynthesis
MNALDVVVVVTRTTGNVREQFGRIIIEAHSCGVPVIGSCSGAIPDVVGEGGWIVPERDATALARLLDALAGDPGKVAQAGIAGKEQTLRRFSFERVAETLACSWHSASELRRANTSVADPT